MFLLILFKIKNIKKMKISLVLNIVLAFILVSCKNQENKINKQAPNQNQVAFKNKGHKLVYQMIKKVGDYDVLYNKKDVVYTYTYKTPKGEIDVSTEKYIFEGELSYGKYKKHERTLPNLEGQIEQGYDGSKFWLKNNGKIVKDSVALKRVAFNRPTNYYWFTMMQKLLDPGVRYKFIKEEFVGKINYDVVKITFESENNEAKDIYQLYINQQTKLVDQFLFTVMDFGKTEPFLMELKYENIEGLLIPTKRRYKSSNWNAEITKNPWILVDWSDIKFNNNLSKLDFEE